MNLLKELFAVLAREEVRYLLVGGVAVNLYGIERATGDIDLMIDLQEDNIRSFIRAADSFGLAPRVPVNIEDLADEDTRTAWREEKGMLVFSLFHRKHSYMLVDVLTEIPVDFDEAYSRRSTRDVDGIPIDVASIHTLIAMKEGTGRPQDEADIHHLRNLIGEDDDD